MIEVTLSHLVDAVLPLNLPLEEFVHALFIVLLLLRSLLQLLLAQLILLIDVLNVPA